MYDRDPACDKYSQAMLYFKGFQAVQSHRVAHWLWHKGRRVSRGRIHAARCTAVQLDPQQLDGTHAPLLRTIHAR